MLPIPWGFRPVATGFPVIRNTLPPKLSGWPRGYCTNLTVPKLMCGLPWDFKIIRLACVGFEFETLYLWSWKSHLKTLNNYYVRLDLFRDKLGQSSHTKPSYIRLSDRNKWHRDINSNFTIPNPSPSMWLILMPFTHFGSVHKDGGISGWYNLNFIHCTLRICELQTGKNVAGSKWHILDIVTIFV